MSRPIITRPENAVAYATTVSAAILRIPAEEAILSVGKMEKTIITGKTKRAIELIFLVERFMSFLMIADIGVNVSTLISRIGPLLVTDTPPNAMDLISRPLLK